MDNAKRYKRVVNWDDIPAKGPGTNSGLFAPPHDDQPALPSGPGGPA